MSDAAKQMVGNGENNRAMYSRAQESAESPVTSSNTSVCAADHMPKRREMHPRESRSS